MVKSREPTKQKNWEIKASLADKFSKSAIDNGMAERELAEKLIQAYVDNPKIIRPNSLETISALQNEGFMASIPDYLGFDFSSLMAQDIRLTVHAEYFSNFIKTGQHEAVLLKRIADPLQNTTLFFRQYPGGGFEPREGEAIKNFIRKVKDVTSHFKDGFSMERGVQLISIPFGYAMPNLMLRNLIVTIASIATQRLSFDDDLSRESKLAVWWQLEEVGLGSPTMHYYSSLCMEGFRNPEQHILCRMS